MEIPIIITPNITGNPAPDKDVISGTDEQAGSVPFLSSLLSMISSLNPINTLGLQDETVNSWQKTEDRLAEDRRQTLASGCLSSVFCIETISQVSVRDETTEKPGNLSLDSYSSDDKPFGKSDASTLMFHKFGGCPAPIPESKGVPLLLAFCLGWVRGSKSFITMPAYNRLIFKTFESTDIQNPISMIEKEAVELSSLNIVQPDHSEEKSMRTTALMGEDQASHLRI